MVSNLSHVFLLLSIILLSIIDSIELRKLLDIDKLEFKFPCGSVQCDGIRQYCSDELTCLYCNEAVCRDTNRPGLCTFQCEKEEMDVRYSTTSLNTTNADSINCDTWTCTYRLELWKLCMIVICAIIFGIIFGIVLLNVKRRQAHKRNDSDSRCIELFWICGCRKKDINVLLREYHATEQNTHDNIV